MSENAIIAKFLDEFEAEALYTLQLDPRERAMQAAYQRTMSVAYEIREFLRNRQDVEQAQTVPELPLHFMEGVENGGYYLASDVHRALALSAAPAAPVESKDAGGATC